MTELTKINFLFLYIKNENVFDYDCLFSSVPGTRVRQMVSCPFILYDLRWTFFYTNTEKSFSTPSGYLSTDPESGPGTR